MEAVFQNLDKRFSGKDFTPFELPRLIKDVKNIVADGGNFTLSTVNEKLENLGWERGIIDELSFELMLLL